jgi:hypothetical protein
MPTIRAFVKLPVEAMKTPTNESRARTRNAWGVSFFSAAAIALLLMVWNDYSPGSLSGLMVLAGLAVGGGLVIRSLCEGQQSPAPLPVSAPPTDAAATDVIPAHLEKGLAEIAVLAWKIDQRAQKEPNPPKAILRNATRIIEMLGEQKVELVSYEGRRVFMGSDVDVLDAVEDDEEDKVVEQHEPEIQISGRLVRRALLTVGKKRKTAASPPSPPSPEPSSHESTSETRQ